MSKLEVELCPDCLTAPGMPHRQGCDVERCRLCGYQAIGCGCHDRLSDHDYRREVALAGGRLHWTGEWPGTEECRRIGWMIAPDVPDLNHLMAEGEWNKTTGQWEVNTIGMAELGDIEGYPDEEEYNDGTS